MNVGILFPTLGIALLLVFLLGMWIYHAYMLFIHIYRSEERMLHITDIEIHRNRNGSRYYYIVGELVDVPGERLRSLDTFPLRSRYHYEGDIIPVKYAGTKRFAVDTQKLVRNVVIIFVIGAVLTLIQVTLH